MPLSVEMLHSQPQTEVYSLIRKLIEDADVVSIAVGFMTEAGISLVSEALRPAPNKLQSLVVGATTFKACEGLNHLLSIGVPPASLKVANGKSS